MFHSSVNGVLTTLMLILGQRGMTIDSSLFTLLSFFLSFFLLSPTCHRQCCFSVATFFERPRNTATWSSPAVVHCNSQTEIQMHTSSLFTAAETYTTQTLLVLWFVTKSFHSSILIQRCFWQHRVSKAALQIYSTCWSNVISRCWSKLDHSQLQ